MLSFFYVPCPSRSVARKIATHLLKKQLIACANVLPITDSMYRWKGKVVRTKEWALIAKTSTKRGKSVEKEVHKVHSYDVPCIVKISASANADFERWLKGELV